jgi:hypothetical protein
VSSPARSVAAGKQSKRSARAAPHLQRCNSRFSLTRGLAGVQHHVFRLDAAQGVAAALRVAGILALCILAHAYITRHTHRACHCTMCVLRVCTHRADYAGRQTTEVWDTADAAGCTGNSFQWHGHSAFHCATTNEYSVAWNYGANFGGPTKSTWTSGADSLTMGNPKALQGSGMFSSHYVADPNYGIEDGGVPACVCVGVCLCVRSRAHAAPSGAAMRTVRCVGA